MAVASTVAFQALEAALRLIYPNEEKVPARALLKRIKLAQSLPENIVDVAEAGFKLRNLYSHPVQQDTISFPMATSMIESTHRLVALLIAMAVNGEGEQSATGPCASPSEQPADDPNSPPAQTHSG